MIAQFGKFVQQCQWQSSSECKKFNEGVRSKAKTAEKDRHGEKLSWQKSEAKHTLTKTEREGKKESQQRRQQQLWSIGEPTMWHSYKLFLFFSFSSLFHLLVTVQYLLAKALFWASLLWLLLLPGRQEMATLWEQKLMTRADERWKREKERKRREQSISWLLL